MEQIMAMIQAMMDAAVAPLNAQIAELQAVIAANPQFSQADMDAAVAAAVGALKADVKADLDALEAAKLA